MGSLRCQAIQPPPTAEGATAYESADAAPLPRSLSEALDALERDEMMRSALGEEFLRIFTTVKRHEIGKWNDHVSDWERNEDLELF
jgi:glutamine synthetase